MIYSLIHRIGFIHIPKAAGTTIRNALNAMYPGDFFEARAELMHVRADRIRYAILGSYTFDRMMWFAVMRHPVHTIWSSFQRTSQVAIDPNRRGYSAAYCDYLDRFLHYLCEENAFEVYARAEWLSQHILPGGLWTTYCGDLPIRPLRFDRLQEDWQEFIDTWELPFVPLGHENDSGVPFNRDHVSDQIYAEIMTHCHYDCARWGYK